MNSRGVLLEIACFSGEECALAALAGADRLELSRDYASAGISAPADEVRWVCENVGLPVMVMVRPRAGNFVYTDKEFRLMEKQALRYKEAGAAGIVAGCLLPDGRLDVEKIKALRDLTYPLQFVLHRAFDHCPHPEEALESAIECGVDRILSTGGAACASEGMAALRKWVTMAEGRLEIMPGGGVRHHNVAQIVSETRARSVHSAARYQGTTRLDSEEVKRLKEILIQV